MTFTAPSSSSESVKPADLDGHLLIIKPIEYKASISTSLGDTDAIEVNIIDVTTGKHHESVLFFNVALKSALKPNIGKIVLAKMGQGIAKPGKSAPWILNPVSDQGDIDSATAALAGAAKAATATQPAAAASGVTPEVQALLDQLGAKAI
jgi:hypothetical protein